jgi:hypothetical protein
LEDGKWTAAGLRNKLIVLVLEGDSRKLVEDLLRDVLAPLSQNQALLGIMAHK